MAKVNKLSEESFVEQSAYQFAQKWAKSLEPGIKAGEELNSTLSKMKDNYELIKKQTLEYAQLEKSFKIAPTRKEFLKLKKRETTLTEQNIVATREQQKLEKSLITTIEKHNLARESTNKALIKKKYELSKLNKIEKENAVLNSKSSTLIEKLNVKRARSIRIIQNLIAKKELGLKLSAKEQRSLVKSRIEFEKYDKAIKKAKTTTKQFQEYVGKYPTKFKIATASIRQFLPLIGAGFGFAQGIQVVKDSIGVVREFGRTMSNIAGIYRTNRKELEPLENKIIEVAGASVNTATDVAKLAESLATLGKTREEIEALLKPVNNLSIGLNASADDSGEFLVQMLNTFGASINEAERYADTIATIRTSTSLDFQKMVDSFQYLAPISKALNKDLPYTGALIGLLADNGIKAERAGRLLGTSQQKLAAEGKTLVDALDELNEAKANNASELELLELASNLFGKQAASLGVILANNSDIIDRNAESIRKNSGALDDLVNEQLTSLDSHFKILASRWEEYILNTDKSTGASNELKKGLKFLSDNLGEIINVTIKVIKWFGIYKAVVFLTKNALTIATKANALYRLSVVAMNGGIKKAIVSLRALKVATASSGIGLFLVALGSAYEIWQSFTSGASEAADKVKELNKELERFNGIQGRYQEIANSYAKGADQVGVAMEGQRKIMERVSDRLKEYSDEKFQYNEAHIRDAKTLIEETHVSEIEAIKKKINTASTYSKRQTQYILDEIAAYQSLEKIIKQNNQYLDDQEKEKERESKRKGEERKRKQDALRKQLAQDSFSLQKYKLEESIEIEKQILENENSSYQRKIIANEQYIQKSVGLLRLEAQQKIKEAKGRQDKINEIELRFQNDKEAIEKEGSENSIKILEEYFNKRKELIEKGGSQITLNNALVDANNELNEALKNEKLSLDQREKLIEEHERKVAEIKRNNARKVIENQIALLEKELLNEKYTTEQKEELSKLISDLKLSLSNVTTEGVIADLQKQREAEQRLNEWKTNQIQKASNVLAESLNLDASNLENFLTGVVDGFGEGLDGVINGISSLSSVVDDVMGSIYQNNMEQLDEERNYWNEYYEERIELAEGDKVQQDLIRRDQEKKEKELEKKRKKEQYKQAKFQRDAAIFQIGINTAQAILGIWAQVPKFDFGVSAGLMTAFVGSLGLAQMAAVASKPLPKYAKGTGYHPGGHALVGEERPEVIMEPNKDPYVVYKPSILDLAEGTKVIPSLEEYEKLMRVSNMASLEFESRKLKGYQEKQNALDNAVLGEILMETKLSRKAFERERNINVNDNSEKIADKITHAIYRNDTINWG